MQLLYPKEEEIMYIIWDIGHPCVISEILKKDPTQKRNTVAKVLIILTNKRYIKVDSIAKTATRTGRAYRAIISRERYEEQKNLFKLVEKSKNAQKGVLDFVSALINSEDINEEFIQEMSDLINEYKRS